MTQATHVALWLAAACAAMALGYPKGAPDKADILQSMLPRHHRDPQQSSTSPYELDVTEVNGTLHMLIGGQSPHRGFLITVAGAEDGQLGAFQQPAPPGCRLLANGTAATHESAEDKQQTAVVWTLPANRQQSTYVIYYTVVMSFSTYWVRLNKTVTVSVAETSAKPSTPAAAAVEATDDASTAVNIEASTVVVNANASTAVNIDASTVVNANASAAVNADAITAKEAATTAANAASGVKISVRLLSGFLLMNHPRRSAFSQLPRLLRAATTIASTDRAGAVIIAEATTAKDATTSAANAAFSEPVISTEQQPFTNGSPSVATDVHSPVSPMAVSSAPAVDAATSIILVASPQPPPAAPGAG